MAKPLPVWATHLGMASTWGLSGESDAEWLSLALPGVQFCRYDRYWELNNPKRVGLAQPQVIDFSATMVSRLMKHRPLGGMVAMYTEPTATPKALAALDQLANQVDLPWQIISYGTTQFAPASVKWHSLQQVTIFVPSRDDRFYHKMYHHKALPVIDTAVQGWLTTGLPVAIATHLIPGENDSPAMVERMINWLLNLPEPVSWQLQRFYPMFELLDKGPTPEALGENVLAQARAAGLQDVSWFDPGAGL